MENVEEESVGLWRWVDEVFPRGEVVEDGEGGAHCYFLYVMMVRQLDGVDRNGKLK